MLANSRVQTRSQRSGRSLPLALLPSLARVCTGNSVERPRLSNEHAPLSLPEKPARPEGPSINPLVGTAVAAEAGAKKPKEQRWIISFGASQRFSAH